MKTIANVYFHIHTPLYRLEDGTAGFDDRVNNNRSRFDGVAKALLAGAGWLPATEKGPYLHHSTHAGYLHIHPDIISGSIDAEAVPALVALFDTLPKQAPGSKEEIQFRCLDRHNDKILRTPEELREAFAALCPAVVEEAIVKAVTTTRRSAGYYSNSAFKEVGHILNTVSLDCGVYSAPELHAAAVAQVRELEQCVAPVLDTLVAAGVIKTMPGQGGATLYRRVVRAGNEAWTSPRRKAAA